MHSLQTSNVLLKYFTDKNQKPNILPKYKPKLKKYTKKQIPNYKNETETNIENEGKPKILTKTAKLPINEPIKPKVVEMD